MLWRNQAGPMDNWFRSADALPPNVTPTKPGEKPFLEGLAETHPGAGYTNVFLMGMPQSLSGVYIDRFAARLEACGAVASAAPNSVCLKNPRANKARPVEYLASSSA